MKKILTLVLVVISLLTPLSVFAVTEGERIFGKISPPPQVANLGPGRVGISSLLNNSISLIYVGASIIFVFMVVFSALQWITSGGDKEKYGAARSRLTHAIIGIILLALSFAIINLIGSITGFELFKGQGYSTPPPPSQNFDNSDAVCAAQPWMPQCQR
ncbi:MAG: pilin [Candidatus Daviesbacteria bacterium]|nr:pilin [Candidatus Daviesbacteria bacterium]